MINLQKKYLDLLLTLLDKHLKDSDVWLFGSRATSECKPFSDIDLAIVSESNISEQTLAELKYDLSESDLPYKVDIVDYSQVDEAFKKIIQNNYVVIKQS